MPRAILPTLFVMTACASAPTPSPAVPPEPAPASASASEPASASAPASIPPSCTPDLKHTCAPEPASAPAPLPTGGIVLIGDIASPPSFDPRSTLDGMKPQLVACYNQARQKSPSLRGKLNLRININETGTVLVVDAEPGGSAADPALVACLGDAIKAVHFPKPPGMATVTAPLVFRP